MISTGLSIDLVFPSIQIPFDGIGDYCNGLATNLSQTGHDVRLLGRGTATPTGGLTYLDAWPDGLNRNGPLVDAVLSRPTDIVLFQFEQFSYGPRGWNPVFPRIVRDLRRAGWAGKAGLIVHETYTRADTLGHAVMSIYQRRQVVRLVRACDVIIFSCELGRALLGRFNSNHVVLPVPSNIPRHEDDREDARANLGWDPSDIVIVVFGAIGDEPLLRETIREGAADPQVRFVYLGKDVRRAHSILRGARADILGPVSDRVASRVFTGADIGLVFPPDGLSGRRGSFAAMAVHGLAIVASRGKYTDPYFEASARQGLFSLVERSDGESSRALHRLIADEAIRDSMAQRIRTSPLARTARVNARDVVAAVT